MKDVKEIFKVIVYTIRYNRGTCIVLLCWFLFCFIALCSCKTTKTTIVDKSEINDSTRVETTIRQDNTITEQNTEKQEEKTEKEVITEDTTINFGEGGGTYNTITGEATNVSSIKSNKETEKLKQELTTLQEKFEQSQNTLQSVRDSIAKVDRDMDLESEIEETYSMSWYWWLAIGALLMLVLIVVIRKIPAVSWLLFWI